jgi:hypothetical protein
LALIFLCLSAAVLRTAFASGTLPEFAYREINLTVAAADGKPVTGAAIYGFCPELNLVWPRRDREFEKRNDVLWDESFLGRTDANGRAKAVLPPGKWGFFAVGRGPGSNGTIVAAWTDFRARTNGEEIRLAPTLSRHWTLCSAEGAELEPKRIFLKPDNYPAWIPIDAKSAAQVEITAGGFQMWAAGDAQANHPGFALGWGALSEKTASGKLLAGKAALVQCKGGVGQARLFWYCQGNFGLEGELNLCHDANVWMTGGTFTLAYRHPVTRGLSGFFVGQSYELRPGGSTSLSMGNALSPGLDVAVSARKKDGHILLEAQLYLVDANGHLLAGLRDEADHPVKLEAAVNCNSRRFAAHSAVRASKSAEGDEPEPLLAGKFEETAFVADLGKLKPEGEPAWEFTAPTGGLAPLRLAKSERLQVASGTFKTDVPRVIERAAQNLLAQLEALASDMDQVAGRKRRVENTKLTMVPGRGGAVSAHNGSGTTIGCSLMFYDTPRLGHTLVHELGHNYGFHHGGLHETVVEVCRCAGGAQLSQQPAKWQFLDRMNGLASPAVPSPNYPNTGLYLYCYAQGGMKFLHFMTAHEYAVTARLLQQDYTNDEATAALLGLALDRDMTLICGNYGLSVTTERVGQAAQAARELLGSRIDEPKP